jgi:hypothetical protein
MILAVHQPQYIPWLGYFEKIEKSELFLFLDDVQFKKREYQNRNRIKTPNGELWLTVPVISKNHFFQKISEVQINTTEDWQKQHFKSLEHNYSKAKYFTEHKAFFEEIYSKKYDLLIDVSMDIINYVLKYLEINTKCELSSKYKVLTQSTQRIIDLAKATNSTVYLSGSGGKDYMDESLFSSNNIGL